MICVLLAAGYATRMYPLTENFPKPLLPVMNKTIVDHLIDDLENNCEIDKYVVISNAKFIDKFEDWKNSSLLKDKIVVLNDGSTHNDNRLGAVKDIVFAIDSMKIDDDVIVLAGDNLLDFSLKSFVDFFKEKGKTSVMRYYENDINSLKKTGVASIDKNSLITKMVEKPETPESNWAIPPFYIYKREDIKKISQGIEEGCPTDAPGSFISWLCTKTDVYAFEMPGNRFDIGSIDGYEFIKDNYKLNA